MIALKSKSLLHWPNLEINIYPHPSNYLAYSVQCATKNPSTQPDWSTFILAISKQLIGKSRNPSLSFNCYLTSLAFSSEGKTPINFTSSCVPKSSVKSWVCHKRKTSNSDVSMSKSSPCMLFCYSIAQQHNQINQPEVKLFPPFLRPSMTPSLGAYKAHPLKKVVDALAKLW